MIRTILPPAVTLVLAVVVWALVVRVFDVPKYLVPPPQDVLNAAWQHAPSLLRATLVTAQAALIGFGLSLVVGVSLGVLLSSVRLLERAVYPFAVFLQTVPLVAIAPLLVMWFRVGLQAVAVSAFIVSLFPVIAATLTGIRSTDPALRDLFRLYGAGPFARVFKLRLPSALPSIFTGLRVAAGLAVIGAIVGEFVAGRADESAGLGILVVGYNRNLQTDLVFAAVAAASLLGLALFAGVNLASYLLLRRWHASAQV